MLLLYAPDIQGGTYKLPKEESRHCIKVLRMRTGDEVHLTDGAGTLFRAFLVDENPNACLVEIRNAEREVGKRSFRLHIAIAPTKNINRFEWFLEKATEIGIEEITPVVCEHSERRTVNHDRLERVMIAAMKQSLKTYMPVLHEMKPLSDLLSKDHKGQKFIAHLDLDEPVTLREKYSPGEDVIILIGPEGDFSAGELQSALTAGFERVNMGTNRLRTETAGIVACHTIALLNE